MKDKVWAFMRKKRRSRTRKNVMVKLMMMMMMMMWIVTTLPFYSLALNLTKLSLNYDC